MLSSGMCSLNSNNMVQDRIYRYFERDPHLHILFIFDPMGLQLSDYADMEWKDGYRFFAFDGAWFNLKYRLCHKWKDEKVILYFNQPEPSDEQSRLQFPLLGEMCAGKVFRSEGGEAYIQQHRISEDYSRFVAVNIDDLQASKVEKMLQPFFEDGSFSPDAAVRAILCNYLGISVLKEWNEIIANLIILDGGDDEDKIARTVRRIRGNKNVLDWLNDIFERLSGQVATYTARPYFRDIVLSIKYNQIVRNISPVPADPYRAYHTDNSAKLERMERLMTFVRNSDKLREPFTEAFIRLGADVREDRIIDCYGVNAGYWYLPESMCWHIIDSNVKDSLRTAPAEVISRMDRILVSNPGNESIGSIVAFVTYAAQYYSLADKLEKQLVLNTPADYIRSYTENGYNLDSCYRLALESYFGIDSDRISDAVHKAKLLLDKDYAEFTNNLNLQWIQCLDTCGASLRSLPGVSRQEDFYEDNIAPSASKQAVIVVDALRYEVAKELVDTIYKKQHEPELGFAIAMLPTETMYCKPSLLPHHSLTLSGARMLVDGAVLDTTEKRDAHVQRYKQKSRCVSFKDVTRNSRDANRELFKNDLVYIFHNDIDEAGHDDNAKKAVCACRSSITELAKTVHSIMSTYNVADVFITADHGFLLNDMEFEDKDKQQMAEGGIDRKSRYYLTESDAGIPFFSKYPLRDVSGIDSDCYVAIPSGTNRVAAPGGYKFAHGGASLQELIIPVIRCRHRRDNVKSLAKVGARILDCSGNIVSSVLLFTILQTDAVANDRKQRSVAYAIFEGDRMVSGEGSLLLSSTDVNPENRKTAARLTLCQATSSNLLELRVWDPADPLNPLDSKKVSNNTLIDRDEF